SASFRLRKTFSMLPMWVSGLFPGRSTGPTASPPPQLDVAIDVLPVVYDPRNVRSVTATLRLRVRITVAGHRFVLGRSRTDRPARGSVTFRRRAVSWQRPAKAHGCDTRTIGSRMTRASLSPGGQDAD